MSFGENLINLRRQKGWSQDDLANNLNISRQAISKWETDISKPDVDNLERISKIFSVTIDNLLDNDLPNDKAVALDVKKKEKKEKTITIVKLMIIAVIILYAISVIYKFASLLVIVNGVQKYANLNNYHYVITTYDENGLVEKEECWFKDGVSKTVTDTINGKTIIFVDYTKNEGFMSSSSQGEKIDLDINQYESAHRNYKEGGQLVDTLPKLLKEKSYLTSLFNAIDINTKVNMYEDGITIHNEEIYVVLNKEDLFPTMVYSTGNSRLTAYALEVNSINNIEI